MTGEDRTTPRPTYPRRDWTRQEEQREEARAARLFMNIVRCPDCGLPWVSGLVHFDCPALEGAPHE